MAEEGRSVEVTTASGATSRIRIWDRPTRLVHWLIVLLVALAWWTESHDQLEWHRRFGYALIGLLIFRLLWGLVGASTARFSAFVHGPATVWRYAAKLVRGQSGDFVLGHNPMGGWSVAALLLALICETALGLFSVDVDGVESGPLAGWVSFDTGRLAARWHDLTFDLLLVLIGLHLCAILYYAVARRQDLVRPMVTGSGMAPEGVAPMEPARWPRLVFAAGLAVALAILISRGFRI